MTEQANLSKLILGALFTLLMMGVAGGRWLQNNTDQIEQAKKDIADLKIAVADVSTMRSDISHMREDIKDLNHWLRAKFTP